MKVKILKQKYRCGSGYGKGYFDQQGFLETLNKVMDWDEVEFPTRPTGKYQEVEITGELKQLEDSSDIGFTVEAFRNELIDTISKGEKEDLKEIDGRQCLDCDGRYIFVEGDKVMELKEEVEEIKDYLGTPPELKPGNVFLWDNGQIISIDSSYRFIVNLSESGPMAIKRFWEEYVYPESILKEDYSSDIDEVCLEIESVSEITSPESLDFYSGWEPVETEDWNLWRRFINIEPIVGVWKERSHHLLIEFSAGFVPMTAMIDPGNVKSLFLIRPESILEKEFKEMIYVPLLAEVFKFAKSKGIATI